MRHVIFHNVLHCFVEPHSLVVILSCVSLVGGIGVGIFMLIFEEHAPSMSMMNIFLAVIQKFVGVMVFLDIVENCCQYFLGSLIFHNIFSCVGLSSIVSGIVGSIMSSGIDLDILH